MERYGYFDITEKTFDTSKEISEIHIELLMRYSNE